MVSTFVTQLNTALSVDATAASQTIRYPITDGPAGGGAARAVVVYASLTSGASNQVNNASLGFVKLWDVAGGVKISTPQRVTAHSIGLGGAAVNGNTASANLIAGASVVNGLGVTGVGNGSTAGTSVFELYLSEPGGLTELVLTVPSGVLTGNLVINIAYEH